MIFSAWDRRHCLDASPSSRSFLRVVFLGRTVTICTLEPLSGGKSLGAPAHTHARTHVSSVQTAARARDFFRHTNTSDAPPRSRKVECTDRAL